MTTTKTIDIDDFGNAAPNVSMASVQPGVPLPVYRPRAQTALPKGKKPFEDLIRAGLPMSARLVVFEVANAAQFKLILAAVELIDEGRMQSINVDRLGAALVAASWRDELPYRAAGARGGSAARGSARGRRCCSMTRFG